MSNSRREHFVLAATEAIARVSAIYDHLGNTSMAIKLEHLAIDLRSKSPENDKNIHRDAFNKAKAIFMEDPVLAMGYKYVIPQAESVNSLPQTEDLDRVFISRD